MIGREAKCEACGETFIPSDDKDLVHLEREDGKVCGGVGEIVGTWSDDDDGITICCAVCGSPDVSYAVWHRPNGGSDGDVFGTWNAGDNTFCDDCDDCTNLVDKGADPELFAAARTMYANTNKDK